MTMQQDAGAWVPAQYEKGQKIWDLRGTATGPRGYKVANKKRARDEDEDEEAGMDIEVMDHSVELERAPKKPRAEVARDVVGVGRTSKRTWKEPGQKMEKITKKTSWEKKMAQKAETKRYRENKDAAVSAFKEKRKAMADRRKEAEKRKAENRKKAEVVQVIRNPATLKRMMKNRKMKKKLVTRDTN
mmetsp:Transcript_14095/g.36182  ORF Transcript_14095/g.36182 Transcript_14095/m.36182 type:complete len:187 (-) Transcript_14095:224-784(-)|eukprot:jgi/Tetstr1/430686/TSEL_020479.t1